MLVEKVKREYLRRLKNDQKRIVEDYLPGRLREGTKYGWEVPAGRFFPQSPLFLSRSHVRKSEANLQFLFRLIREIPKRLFQNDLGQMGKALGLPEETIDILEYFFPRGKGPFMARPDCIPSDPSLCVVEANIDCALGGSIAMEFYIDYFEKLPFWPEFSRRYHIRARRPWNGYRKAIQRWIKRVDRRGPCVYISPHKEKDPELALIPQFLKKAGVNLVLAEPEALEVKKNRLYLKEKRVEKVFTIELRINNRNKSSSRL